MAWIRVAGMDPALRNWGIALGRLETVTGEFRAESLLCLHTEKASGKQVRVNSDDINASEHLFRESYAAVRDCQAVFVEPPVNSQNASGMKSYGVCCGVLGAIRACHVPLIEVTYTEVKLAGAGDKNASKKAQIDWATQLYPQLNWPTHKKHGQVLITESEAEHLADALAAIHAGVRTNQFRSLLTMLNPILR